MNYSNHNSIAKVAEDYYNKMDTNHLGELYVCEILRGFRNLRASDELQIIKDILVSRYDEKTGLYTDRGAA